jgi:hypothetical protein
MKMTSIIEWHGFAVGQRIMMLVETRGANGDDIEIEHPVGSSAAIVAIADFGPHQGYGVDVVVGEGNLAICNSFDDSDVDKWGRLPFRDA